MLYSRFVAPMSIWVFLVGAILHPPSIAGTTGKITGRVTDKSTGEPLVGATVLLEGTRLGAATDIDGYYTLLNVPPGNYTLKVSMVGYAETRVTNVKVSVDFTTKLDVALEPSAVQAEAITIVAERPLIRKDLTSSSATVSAEQIQAMPVESYQDILQLQAG
ncbi:MAG: carboxypeptidase-like regulatory domain-containing protein, partial [Armatimonadota bacterium]